MREIKAGAMTDKTFNCPTCGEEVPEDALSCPHCGACEETGWKEDAAVYDGVDLPDDDFNYDEFVKKEFGPTAKPRNLSWLWWFAGIVTVLAFLYCILA